MILKPFEAEIAWGKVKLLVNHIFTIMRIQKDFSL